METQEQLEREMERLVASVDPETDPMPLDEGQLKHIGGSTADLFASHEKRYTKRDCPLDANGLYDFAMSWETP